MGIDYIKTCKSKRRNRGEEETERRSCKLSVTASPATNNNKPPTGRGTDQHEDEGENKRHEESHEIDAIAVVGLRAADFPHLSELVRAKPNSENLARGLYAFKAPFVVVVPADPSLSLFF
ncbi:hypothetical protein H6P81_002106 [Aristolochia fimbriata]|uniref:Uncharacterized protein n=1 Tax=Aristolochia fimbriata TaxID=158543 RepID=A0AAV7F943_ARIFI|nr:hypothetical protein H6P81_002106 [Aristolochia fimbriata]